MKKIMLGLLVFFITSPAFSQTVGFTGDSVLIDKQLCFTYSRTDNNFTFFTLDNKKIIEGNIKNIAPQKFSTTYHFLTVGKDFYKEGVNGRNAIIFLLVQTKVIESCQLDDKKLLNFIEKYNELPAQ